MSNDYLRIKRKGVIIKDLESLAQKKATDFVEMVALLNCPLNKNCKLIHYKYTIFREILLYHFTMKRILYIKN